MSERTFGILNLPMIDDTRPVSEALRLARRSPYKAIITTDKGGVNFIKESDLVAVNPKPRGLLLGGIKTPRYKSLVEFPKIPTEELNLNFSKDGTSLERLKINERFLNERVLRANSLAGLIGWQQTPARTQFLGFVDLNDPIPAAIGVKQYWCDDHHQAYPDQGWCWCGKSTS